MATTLFDSRDHNKMVTADRRLRILHPHDPKSWPTLDPLSQLVHSILSQKTTSYKTSKAFKRIISRYQTWEEVRDAPFCVLADLCDPSKWPELKAERIHAALRHITARYGRLTLDPLEAMSDREAGDFLASLPGVGPKTSASILLFSSLRRSTLPVDSHYRRVTTRLGVLPRYTEDRYAHRLLRSMLPDDWPADEMEKHYIAVKRHGQTCCTVYNQRCSQCCLKDICGNYLRSVSSFTKNSASRISSDDGSPVR